MCVGQYSYLRVVVCCGDYILHLGENIVYTFFECCTCYYNLPTLWSEKGLSFKAVYAEHSDRTAIGVIIAEGEKNYYVTGDTLFNSRVFSSIDVSADAVFLPINGKGNNMNAQDAALFCKMLGEPVAVPLHFGMFDSINPEIFDYKNRIIPEIYKEIKFSFGGNE